MESRFRHDFSQVRIHSDHRAAVANRFLSSNAFTFGNDIVFDRGKYAPESASGRYLLAHELTHVLQSRARPGDRPEAVGPYRSAWETEASDVARQVSAGGAAPPIRPCAASVIHRNGGSILSGRPPVSSTNLGPPPGPFIEGRPAHNHPASPTDWALVQADAAARCSASPDRIDCACGYLSPANVIAASNALVLFGAAQDHFDHYRSGGGADLNVDITASRMLRDDSGARGPLAREIGAGSNRGHVFIQQTDYAVPEFKNAFGGIDRVDFYVDRANGNVHVWFKDRYDFHPVGFGYANMGAGDVLRNTNCVHAAAVELKATGAADFWMFGYTVQPLALFTGGSGGRGGSREDSVQ